MKTDIKNILIWRRKEKQKQIYSMKTIYTHKKNKKDLHSVNGIEQNAFS